MTACHALYGQKEENMWAFGYNAGLDFSSGSPVPFFTGIEQLEGCASICDATGQLLFYTNGAHVWDRRHQVMPNGSLLQGSQGVSSVGQAAVIARVPGSNSRYYLFSVTHSIDSPGPAIKATLFHSIIDMSLNGGWGDVLTMPQKTLLRDHINEEMTIVYGNQCNYWLIVRSLKAEGYQSYEISAAGINPVPVVSPVDTTSSLTAMTGMIKASPDRTKIVSLCRNGPMKGIRLYSFDPGTGRLSDPKRITRSTPAATDTTVYGYGACFSPDNSKLYLDILNDLLQNEIVQYDLGRPTFTEILASQTRVAYRPRNMSGDMKAGPDGKIYQTSAYPADTVIHVIHSPDLPGTACGYEENAIRLPAGMRSGYGLPNAVCVVEVLDDTLTIYRDTGLCFRDSIVLQANDISGMDYMWDDGTTGPYRTVTTSGIYTIIYPYWGCTYRVEHIYVRFSAGLPALSVQQQSCRGEAKDIVRITPFPGDTTIYTYRWHDNAGNLLRNVTSRTGDELGDIGAGSYQVHLHSTEGCDTMLFFTLTEPDYNASFIGDTVICQYAPVSFTNTSTNDLSDFRWDFGDGNTSAQFSPEHTYDQPGVYRVRLTASNPIPCNDTFYHTVTVDSLPYLYLNPDRDRLCVGETVMFRPVYRPGTDSLVWEWREGQPDQVMPFVYSFVSPGTYPVTVTATYSPCRDTSASDTMYVAPLPLVELGSDTFYCPGEVPLRLVNLKVGKEGDQYHWSNGAHTAAITVKDPGTYWLQVISDNECAATDSVTIHRSCFIDLPNVFTPNGDGTNDYFFPRGLLTHGMTSFHMQVFNRWGQLVYESRNLADKGWDGRFNGDPVQEGVYVYQVSAGFRNGTAERYRGNVTLLR